ncbi:MAG TPA: hypothetical protein GX002_05850 [Clostridiales bacterium]|jgi:6-pyruvoyl tetrahydropterin synthase-like protein|nr:hypothetical protein [Clostridiales bacterium]
MELKVHKLHYYLNSRHSIDNSIENAHSHTFSVGLYIEDKNNEKFLNIKKVNKVVSKYLNQFRGVLLNHKPAFQDRIPTIEHIGDLFYEELRLILMEHNYNLIQLDICENPLQIYSVSDRLW